MCSYKYYADLRPVHGLEEYLRHQYNVHRWVGSAGEYICQKLKMSEEEVPAFVANLFIQRFVGGKEDFFRDKLPMPEEKFKRLFMNFLIDSFLAGTDGLTLFSRNQSLADSCFLFLYIWLGKAADKTSLPFMTNESLPIGIHLEGADDPHAKTEIGDYMGIALKYFLDHKVDLSELPPLIVFPDKSCFSPCS